MTLTKRQQEIITNMFKQGKTLQEIQIETGIPRHTISEELEKLGIRQKRYKGNQDDYINIAKDYLSGKMSNEEIREKYGFKGESVIYSSVAKYKEMEENKEETQPHPLNAKDMEVLLDKLFDVKINQLIDVVKEESKKTYIVDTTHDLESEGYSQTSDGDSYMLKNRLTNTPIKSIKLIDGKIHITRYRKETAGWGTPYTIDFKELEAIYNECIKKGWKI